MPKVQLQKLKVIDVAQNETVEPQPEEPKTNAEQMTTIKEDFEEKPV